jgi:hypothetical protein
MKFKILEEKLTLFILILALSFQVCFAQGEVKEGELASFKFPSGAGGRVVIQSMKCNPTVNDLRIQRLSSRVERAGKEYVVLTVLVSSGACDESTISDVWSEVVLIPPRESVAVLNVRVLSGNITVFTL